MMAGKVLLWWFFLCAVGGLNILAWSLSAAALARREATLSGEIYASRRLQLYLSAGYVFGCAFRSALPVYDVQRLCLFDSWLCSVIVGRSIATIAELCFAMQWALVLRRLSSATGSMIGRTTAMAVVAMIAVAESCSWYSVLTTSNLGHVAEESLWGLSAALIVASIVALWPRCDAALRPVLTVWCVAAAAYVAYMFLVDVPMYWSRWIADEAAGRHYLSVGQGVLDASSRWVVSHRWNDWRSEVAWMSLYFSVAVWFSIWLVHAPMVQGRAVADGGKRPRATLARALGRAAP